jgi:hypothetical protein
LQPSGSAARIALLSGWLRGALDSEQMEWFEKTLAGLQRDLNQAVFARAIGLASRKVGKRELVLTPEDLQEGGRVRAGFDATGMTVDEAARIAFILASDEGDRVAFVRRVADLYRSAAVAEAVGILRGLPMFPAGHELLCVAREGVRSAIKPIFEALAHRNPYPAEFFDNAAWNQMLLKAVFIGSSLVPIQGLRHRANPELAEMLVDYAHERWAAERPVSPEVWLCVGPFARGRMLNALERVMATGTAEERAAAASALGVPRPQPTYS